MLVNGILCLIALVTIGQAGFAQVVARVQGKSIRIEFDNAMHSRVVALLDGGEHVIGDFTPSEFIRLSGTEIQDFAIQEQKRDPLEDRLGSGYRTVIIGTAQSLKKVETITVYDQFPRMAFFDVEYTNTSTADLPVSGWTNQ